MSLNWTSYVNSLGNLLVVATTDLGFTTALPNIIDDAEQRIYRDLDLLNTVVRDSSRALVAGSRNFSFPSTLGTFVVVDRINVITPSGTTNPDNGTRNALMPASLDTLDVLFPSVSGSTVPNLFAMVSQSSMVVGPWPDAAYQVEVTGTIRPAPLSSSTLTTLLTVYFPDLFLAASMVFGAGYQKNYGQGVDDPSQAVTWESHYKELLQSAKVEEARKKFQAEGWSDKQPSPVVTPPRT